ncbi:MFS transporter [Gilliamella sp. ESL0441]|uniref:hypothetical protein n=1 Tax=Gilliamella sp. ESL0441 TaxID=2704654 RepID=UPI001C6A8D08|nr:hypothetical protein [Gilliamella sp. ESL0441]QYN44050.1 MFS transporter [Gilliamella sp. ESL0441]
MNRKSQFYVELVNANKLMEFIIISVILLFVSLCIVAIFMLLNYIPSLWYLVFLIVFLICLGFFGLSRLHQFEYLTISFNEHSLIFSSDKKPQIEFSFQHIKSFSVLEDKAYQELREQSFQLCVYDPTKRKDIKIRFSAAKRMQNISNSKENYICFVTFFDEFIKNVIEPQLDLVHKATITEVMLEEHSVAVEYVRK